MIAKWTLELQHELPFGKYEGHTVEEVIAEDPSYINWAIENDIIELDDEAYREFEEAFDEDTGFDN